MTIFKAIPGKSAFQLWKEIPGNENKTLTDYDAERADKVYVDQKASTEATAARTGAVSDIRNGVVAAGDDLAKLYALIETLNTLVTGTTPDGDAVVNTIQEVLAVMSTYPEGTDILGALNGKIDNSAILNALTETVAGKVLDARQGKVLNDLITGLQSSKVDKSSKIIINGVEQDFTAGNPTFTVKEDIATNTTAGLLPANTLDNLARRDTSNEFAVTQTFQTPDRLLIKQSALSNYIHYSRNMDRVSNIPFADAWHDILAFCKVTTPVFQQSADGTAWTNSTLDKKLFIQKQSSNIRVMTNGSHVGARWHWTGIGGGDARWLVISYPYHSTIPNVTVSLEVSSDNAAWTTIHTSTYNANSNSVYHYAQSTGNHYRLTIIKNSGAVDLSLSEIRYLSARPGNQGRGREDQLPYDWDENGVILVAPDKNVNGIDIMSASQKASIGTIDGDGKLRKGITPANKMLSTDIRGNVVARTSTLVRAPFIKNGSEEMRFAEILRGLTDVSNASRTNLLLHSTYTHAAYGTYGWHARQASTTDDTRILPVVIHGKNALKFTLTRNQDSRPERSELLESTTDAPFSSTDRERWLGTAIHVPRNAKFDLEDTAPIVLQFHDDNDYNLAPDRLGRIPCQSLRIENGHWKWWVAFDLDVNAVDNNTTTQLQYDLGPVNFGSFTRFVVHIKWSKDTADGFVRVYKDDVKVLDYTGATTYNDLAGTTAPEGKMPYVKFGIYNYRWDTTGQLANDATTIMNEIVVSHGDTRYALSNGSYATVDPDKSYNSYTDYVLINTHSDRVKVENEIIMKDTALGTYHPVRLTNGTLVVGAAIT